MLCCRAHRRRKLHVLVDVVDVVGQEVDVWDHLMDQGVSALGDLVRRVKEQLQTKRLVYDLCAPQETAYLQQVI